MSSPNNIFNVEEVTGKERSALLTTAAEAQIQAPTAKIAREIETNADQEKAVAQQAANAAKTIGEEDTGEPMTATDKLQKDASDVTNAAVLKGRDVEAVGTEYVKNAKALAQSAIATVQTDLPSSVPNLSNVTGKEPSALTNTDQGKAAAQQAANSAKTIAEEYTGKSMTATDQLQKDASNVTNDAILEGKEDVEHVKTVGTKYAEQVTEYAEQVKALAQSAFATVQTYVTGTEPSALETTAQTEAPTAKIARQIETITDKGKAAAQQAANSAKEYTGKSMTAIDQLQKDASNVTNAAVGRENVEHVKTVGKEYVENVKALAQDAVQTYLPPNLSEGTETNTESQSSSGDIPAPLEGRKKTVGKEYVENVKALAQSAVQTHLPLSVPNLSEGTETNTESQSSSGDIPAPLESGPHIVNSTTTTKGGGED